MRYTVTQGKIKGYVKFEDILEFIRNTYDITATRENYHRTTDKKALAEHEGFTLNEHSENSEHWYCDSGSICFDYNGEKRKLFYSYNNIRLTDEYNNADVSEKEAFACETTYISLGSCGSGVEIIKEIVASFGGGWVDEDESDNIPHRLVMPKELPPDTILALPFGTVIKVHWNNDTCEYKGLVFGGNVGYEDGRTETLVALSKNCANDYCRVFHIEK